MATVYRNKLEIHADTRIGKFVDKDTPIRIHIHRKKY